MQNQEDRQTHMSSPLKNRDYVLATSDPTRCRICKKALIQGTVEDGFTTCQAQKIQVTKMQAARFLRTAILHIGFVGFESRTS